MLNVAGLLHIPGAMSPEVSYERVTPENILLSFKVTLRLRVEHRSWLG